MADEATPSLESRPVKSKSALKRERKEEQMSEWKKQKKQLTKDRKKARKAFEKQVSGAEAATAISSSQPLVPNKPRTEQKQEFLAKCEANFSIIIDCAWDSHLVGRPLKSLAQQIIFCYGLNRKASNPCSMHLTGVPARLREQLDKSSASSWTGVHVSADEYLSLPCFSAAAAAKEGGDGVAPAAQQQQQQPRRPQQLVYLTSDADETLSAVDPDTAYIIGGIVDRNAIKGATLPKPQTQGLRVAKLPIKEHVKLETSPVLTVNHVFELLLRFQQCGSWGQAIAEVLPQRKGVVVKGGAGEEGEEGEDG